MTSVQKIRRYNNLAVEATSDRFEEIGYGLLLCFVRGEGHEIERDFVCVITKTEARQELKKRKAEGWRNCWRMFGDLCISSGLD